MHVAQFFDALALRPDIKIVEAALLDFSRKFGLREVRGNSGTDGCDPHCGHATNVVLLPDQRHAGKSWLNWGQFRPSPNLSTEFVYVG